VPTPKKTPEIANGVCTFYFSLADVDARKWAGCHRSIEDALDLRPIKEGKEEGGDVESRWREKGGWRERGLREGDLRKGRLEGGWRGPRAHQIPQHQ
jgi:hypothetical protein